MFKREKDLAILLVVMVCFMIFQTFLILFLDKRMDRIENDQNAIRQEIIVSQQSARSKHKDKLYDADIGVVVKSIYNEDAECLVEDEMNIEKCVTDSEISAEKCEEHEKADTEAAETHEKAVSDYGIWDEDYILRVLTAEAGSDEVLCGCVAQALYNACEKHGWEYDPQEIMWKYSYTSPASWISDAAVLAYDQVFCSGVRYTDVGNAIYFYAPQYCDSPWHESQRFVCEVSGVRFFEENN